jgi:hypothetical protein
MPILLKALTEHQGCCLTGNQGVRLSINQWTPHPLCPLTRR